jgi:hypothetical protein
VQRRLDEVQNARARQAGAAVGPPTLSRPARIAIFAVSLLAGLGVARAVTATVVSWWSNEPAVVRAVAVQGSTRLGSEEVARSVGISRNHPIEDLAPEQIEAQLELHPWVRGARVAILPTGTVLVEIDERQPQAVLLRPGETALFVDAEGLAFAEVGEPDRALALSLPSLSLAADAGAIEADGDPLPLAFALALLDHIAGLDLPGLSHRDLPHRGLQLTLPPRGASPDARRGWVLRCAGEREVILGGGEALELSERLDRLEQLLAAGLGEIERTTEIDLRFAGQAVLRTKGTSG